MFKSLRAKLIISYIAIISICLVLAGVMGLFWLHRYEQEAALARTRMVAQTLLRAWRALPGAEMRSIADAWQYLRRQNVSADELIFLLDDAGRILASGPSGVSEDRLPLPLLPALQQEGKLSWRRWQSRSGAAYYLVYAPLARNMDGALSRFAMVRYIVLAAPAEDIQQPWREWLPPFLGIGALALIFAVLVSYALFRSVTQPLAAMTRAAEEMAQGHYRQEIPVNSQDEIGRLASAFNRMAQEVERVQRAQRDFLVNISHDLQTPLTSIHGFSQAISEGTIHDADAVRRAEAVIFEEADRMERLIKDVSDLVRLEGGQIEMARAPVRVEQLVDSVVEQFTAQAKEGNVLLKTDLSEDLPTILGDAERLEQVLSHLVDNALKYTPAGGQITVSVRTEQVGNGAASPFAPKGGRWVGVTVTDTGTGIRAEDLHRVFERMYRADKARAGKDGAGLGLTIAREIVQAHGGYISVVSQPNEGSQFHIWLPAANHAPLVRKN
jgi:signal transduction histidine kinase